MLKTPEQLRELTSDLGTSVWTLSAIGALFESGLVEHLREPRSVEELAARCAALTRGQIERALAVAAEVGVVVRDGGRYRLGDAAAAFADPPRRAALHGDIRANLMQALAFLDASRGERATAGWLHTDPALLQAQGDASSALAPMMKAMILPQLDGLAARTESPGARFLDVGVGVAALAIAMCRVFPQLQVVGLDCFDAPLALALRNVAGAGLAERIELRQSAVEQLRDEQAFDLAWLPSFFIPSLEAPVARIHAALRPGGFILLALEGSGGTPHRRAVFALMNELWGGPRLAAADGEAMLRNAGFSSVRTLPGPAWAPALVVGQR